MNTPNPELMHLYGTDAYYLEKTGQFPLLAKLLGAAGSVGLYLHDKRHVDRLLADAEQVNQQLRIEQARRMHNVEDAISGRGGIRFRSRPLPPPASDDLNIPAPTGDPVMLRFERDIDDEMAKGSSADMRAMAEHIGRCMARQYVEELHKEAAWRGDDFTVELLEKAASGEPLTDFEKLAIFGLLRRAGGAIKSALPKSGTSKFLAAAKAEGVAPAAAPGMLSKLKSKLPMSGNARMMQAAEKEGLGDVARAAKKAPGAAPTQIAAGPYRMNAAPPAAAAGAAGAAAPAAGAAAAGAAPAAAGAAAPAAKSKPWLSMGTKAKIGIGAAGLGAGYLGYKALQTGRDYMMQPTQTGGSYGHYGPQVQHDVNQYGYVSPYGG